MGTKVRKKDAKREKVPTKTTKLWFRTKEDKGLTYFDLMITTGLSEGTLRNAFKGYADKGTVEKINAALNPQTEAA
jgi:cyanate lyase